MKVTTDACLFGAWAAREIGDPKSGARKVLDIGTGTGLLSLMIAQQSDALIDAIEIDKAAAEQAVENVAASPWKERINLIHGDIKEVSVMFPYKYDSIISNPPFYENELTSPDYIKNLALHNSGLLLDDLLRVVHMSLNNEGIFYLLLPYKRMAEAGILLKKNYLAVSHTALVKQSAEHDYFRIFIAGKHIDNSKGSYIKSEIVIRDEMKEYTKEFIEFLKSYYLYL